VADALFTRTQQRVLAQVFGQPERSFFAKELIVLTGGGNGAVQRELMRLLASGLIVPTVVLGRQKYYKANADGPIFAELCAIATKILAPVDTLRRALLPLADELHLALLYRSLTEHHDKAHSDFDALLMLLVSDVLTLEQVHAILEPVGRQLGRVISPILYTRAEFRNRLDARNPFLTKLLASETVALIGDKRAFVDTAGSPGSPQSVEDGTASADGTERPDSG
jgi:hypothetical protein